MTTHLALVGPTASGKSELALAIARACTDVEIISLDAMQVYRGMNVGTAKPSPAELTEVPHHLIDVADPSEAWSVQRTQAGAYDALAAIERRGNRALFVGGTGLYVRAVVDQLTIPGGDDDVRAALLDETEDDAGLARAYARLADVDPTAAARIEPNNRRRITRALEVITVTGQLFSSFGPGLGASGPTAFPVTLVGCWMTRDALATRINARVDGMRTAGLAEEVERLRDAPGGLSRTAAQAIGYKELLDRPVDPEAAFALIAQRTRQFARRQRMWFRRDERIVWVAGDENASARLGLVLALWDRARPQVYA